MRSEDANSKHSQCTNTRMVGWVSGSERGTQHFIFHNVMPQTVMQTLQKNTCMPLHNIRLRSVCGSRSQHFDVVSMLRRGLYLALLDLQVLFRYFRGAVEGQGCPAEGLAPPAVASRQLL